MKQKMGTSMENKTATAMIVAAYASLNEKPLSRDLKKLCVAEKIMARDNSKFIGLSLPKSTYKRNKKTGY